MRKRYKTEQENLKDFRADPSLSWIKQSKVIKVKFQRAENQSKLCKFNRFVWYL